MRNLQVHKSGPALVDDEDYQYLCCLNWYLLKDDARDKAIVSSADGRTLYLHRVIMGNPVCLVDHIDRDIRNNQRSNLRLATNAENTRNSGPRVGLYKGVCVKGKKYMAQIKFEGKNHYLGLFEYEMNAAKAYDRKARELFGEFAYLNFPEIE